MEYKLRACGTNDFVSCIDPLDPTCSPLGSVEYVTGWARLARWST